MVVPDSAKSRACLFSLLVALSGFGPAAAEVVVVEGQASEELVRDSRAWLERRERFIRLRAAALARLDPRLPVVYRLDRDFVAAARERKTTAVVDDCGERTLCGVATDELEAAWENADLRALFTSPGEPPYFREAYAAALLGRFEGEPVEAWAADLLRAGLGDPRATNGERRIVVPVLASVIRAIDPEHRLRSTAALGRVRNLTAEEEARWRAGMAREPASTPRRRPARLRGATFSIVVNRLERHMLAAGSRAELERLRGVGYDAIGLIPFGGQPGFDGTEIRRFDGPGGESDLAMTLGAARTKRLGMRVMLKPHLWPMRSGSGDATRIEPSDWNAWFASYERFIIHYALLARAIGAEWFSIGTELTRTESRPEWRSIIAKVRAVYHGSITYAANFDAFERTPFWDALDAVGVDAYFPLATHPDADDRALREGAKAAVARIERVSARVRKPAILTEIGYPSIATAWIEPWNERRSREVDHAAQARAFDAMLRAVTRSRAIAGFFVWKYETDPAFTDPDGFLPKEKPAERVISRYLK